MIIKPNHAFIGMPTMATIELFSGDHVSITYKKPNGVTDVMTIDARHLVMMAMHQGTDASIISDSTGVSVLQPGS